MIPASPRPHHAHLLLAALLCLTLPGCSPGPGTRVYVFNVSTGDLDVGGSNIEYWHSLPVDVANGSTERLGLRRDHRDLGTLVITSLMPAADPADYDAAINVHEDSTGSLYLGEYSPYIDARLE